MTTGVSFGDTSKSSHSAKQKADLYMRIYQYASEDFASIPDLNNFAKDVLAWAQSVEYRMQELGAQLNSHTHELTPHFHKIPDHVHHVIPHSHISGAPGSPTSMEQLPLFVLSNGPKVTIADVNKGVQTMPAINASKLRWQNGNVPPLPLNTTGSISNLSGNKVVMGTGNVSAAAAPELHKRRSLVIPILNTPDVPPVLAG